MMISTAVYSSMSGRKIIRSTKVTLLVVLLLLSLTASAVHINPEGEGQVLIYPYYTVNNNLNTAYSVVNTTDRPKAVKVTFREAQAGLMVFTFNVYLDAFDVWTGALGPTTSNLPGHTGEPNVVHVSGDASCVPRVLKSGEKFIPDALDDDLPGSDSSLERARTGYFTAIELGELTGEAAFNISHVEDGQPYDCNAIGASWNTGEWTFDDLDPPGGGLTGSAFVVNVAEGVSLSYDAVALQSFWAEDGLHTEPGSELPDLSSGSSESRVLLEDGTLAVSTWNTGFEAVSAVFMHSEVLNEYMLDQIVNGKSEWLLTFPAKYHHVVRGSGQAIPPFNSRWNGLVSCDEYEVKFWDRESMEENISVGGPRPPAPPLPSLCHAANVMIIHLPGDAIPSGNSELLGSREFRYHTTPAYAYTESGWVRMTFSEDNLMVPESGAMFRGLPVTGFVVSQFTNAGAGEGLLAQYGSVIMNKGRVTVSGMN